MLAVLKFSNLLGLCKASGQEKVSLSPHQILRVKRANIRWVVTPKLYS